MPSTQDGGRTLKKKGNEFGWRHAEYGVANNQ